MTRDVRAALLASVATVMTMLSLSPLLADRDWLQPVVLVVAAVGLAGAGVAAGGLPRWLGVPAGALAALVIATALLVPSQAALGGFVPTPSSLRALEILTRSGVVTAQAVLPPAPTDAGITTLVTLAAGLVAVVTAAVAGPLRRPGAAGLPLLLVVCVATALAPDGVGLLGFLSAGLGYLGLTLVDADARVRGWGAVLGRRTRGGQDASSGVGEELAVVAASTAAVALAVGALLPLVVPGSGGERLQAMVTDRFGGGGEEGLTSVNPFLDIREDLQTQDDTVLISYSTTDEDPDPLRLVTADTFDGALWEYSQGTVPTGADVSEGMPAPPGTSPAVLSAAEAVSTSVAVGPLVQGYLPLPYPAATVDVEGRWVVDPRTLTVGATDATTEDLTYQVSSYDISPDPSQLAQGQGDDIDPVWTELPGSMSEVVLDEARRVVEVAGAETRYDQALALQQWFRNTGGFTYSLDAPDTTDRDAVEAFLADRRGYCVQFASTMALMARSLDIPARVAIGFLPGEEVEPGRWEIRADDAHAWPELYFEGVGWVRFEPTPGTRTGQPPAWAVPQSDPAPAQPSTAPSQAAPLPPEDRPRDSAAAGAGAEDSVWERVAAVGVPVLQVLLGLGVAALALALPRAWRWWRSRRRL
ncbi:transglutaminaseTgpA domain-containing protein, partial [Aquipuribacter hungaricus]